MIRLNIQIIAFLSLLLALPPTQLITMPSFSIIKYNIKPLAPKYNMEDYLWMARNVYHEARNQSDEGKLAVIKVTLNRLKDPRWPNTIKEIVTEKIRGVCQFSWYCDSRVKMAQLGNESFERIYDYVKKVMNNSEALKDPTNGATFYHATYVRPKWSYRVAKTVKIGDHIFYR